MIKEKKYNGKYLFGFLLGILLSGTVVYATITYSASDIFYNSNSSSLTRVDVQGAIDELDKKIPFCAGICYPTGVSSGDYVSYTPSSTSYTTDTTKTGYTSTQTINPSELNLWRVLSVNNDGTVDIISEYVSSTKVYFKGLVGYQNYIGYLNELAAKYRSSIYTVESRYFGYNGQTEYITNTSYFVNPAPWTCHTGYDCSPDPDNYEAYGGGDTGYISDYDLVNTVLGTRSAYKVGTTTATSYWMASRVYTYISSTGRYNWSGRDISVNGNVLYDTLYYYDGGFKTGSYALALRPIVTLKSGLHYSGSGTSSNPWTLS